MAAVTGCVQKVMLEGLLITSSSGLSEFYRTANKLGNFRANDIGADGADRFVIVPIETVELLKSIKAGHIGCFGRKLVDGFPVLEN